MSRNHLATLSCALVVSLPALACTVEAAAETVIFTITIDGTQDADLIDTPATGIGSAALELGVNEFTWELTFTDLIGTETAAHFHGPAQLCDTAGAQITLPLGSPKVGATILTDEQAADLLAGLWYINIHTTAHGSGEIRGQVLPAYEGQPFPDPIAASPIHLDPEVVATGLTAPNWGIPAPGIADRLFVSDQNGILWNVNLHVIFHLHLKPFG